MADLLMSLSVALSETEVAPSVRINLLETVCLLNKHLTEALCQQVFQSTRTTERQREWSLFALGKFWTTLDALNKVRRAELAKAAGRFRGLLAGKKFILLSRQAHVRGKAREALNDLLGASRELLKAHLLKESFNHLWTYKSKTCARRFFNARVDQLKWSRLKPYHKFARMVESHFDGILACCDKRVSLGYLEATNLKAKNLVRRAYGFRDDEYMRLKIIQVCTPWMGVFSP